MNEQQLADGFQAVLADEPPMGFDPDKVIDRAIKQRRRRRLGWIAASATMIEAAVVWALIAAPGGDDPTVAGPASGQAGSPPPSYTYSITGFEQVLSHDQPLFLRETVVELRVEDVLARNPDGDSGVVQLRRGETVVLSMNLENFREYDMHYTEPLIIGPDAVNLDVTCSTPATGCKNVSMTISGFKVERDR